ncbi:MAG: double-strand break repair protein AddB [Pseudomonadota bacterium]
MAETLFNIPAGQPFARILAQSLLDEYQTREDQLAQVLILLPTRRACRVLQDAFLELRGQKPLILPRMQPVGDLDEEELSLSILGHQDGNESWDMPAALSPIRRQILLSRLIAKAHPERTQDQTLKLAQALGQLMDQIYTENLDMANLVDLVPEEFAKHWQITLEFLEIISENWPKILKDLNVIDEADRRNRLILALAGFWKKHPPKHPVIGAGSTGSIPATAQLLSVISELPHGKIILPGLDSDMDEDSWEHLSESHPQFGFKQLLGRMNKTRQSVKTFQACEGHESDLNAKRQILTREIMRPAETTSAWATLKNNQDEVQNLKDSLEGMSLIECEHGRAEADAIAILLRQTLNDADKTACLITPDRTLAKRVSASCQRWGITIDDSAGTSLKNTSRGTLFRLSAESIIENAAPNKLLSTLKHPLCHIDNIALHALDCALRGLKPANGFEGLRAHIQKQERLEDTLKETALSALDAIESHFGAFLSLKDRPAPFFDLLKAHIALCESLTSSENTSGEDLLWSGEEGQKAARFFAKLFDLAHELGPISMDEYIKILEHFMDQEQIRPSFGTHPRLQILGQLEARLIDADLVILGGLNEGIWPAEPAADPWMSRPMRKEFGLPSPERSVGLAAHDFAQGLCAPNVVLTRAERADGAPSVPSRWLQRFDAVLQAAQLKPETLKSDEILGWTEALDRAVEIIPAQRPMPAPPIKYRPRRLSVTQIETWLHDPYAIYARHILGLKIMEPLEKPIDAAERGTLLHTILQHFVDKNPRDLPDNPAKTLINIARNEIENRHEDPSIWSFWWSRFTKTAQWIAQHEKEWRQTARNIATETKGTLEIQTEGQNFTLSAIADRIDSDAKGRAAIIDYKSGGQFSKSGLQTGELPQLPLEALILRHGGFDKIESFEPSSLQYWVLSGQAGGKITTIDQELDQILDNTSENLKLLIEAYDDPQMPYICLPRADKAPRFNDYEHLARIKEWSVSADASEEEAA